MTCRQRAPTPRMQATSGTGTSAGSAGASSRSSSSALAAKASCGSAMTSNFLRKGWPFDRGARSERALNTTRGAATPEHPYCQKARAHIGSQSLVLLRDHTCCGASASALRSRFRPCGPVAACADALDAPAASPCTPLACSRLNTTQTEAQGCGHVSVPARAAA